jgi:hypothetical protein
MRDTIARHAKRIFAQERSEIPIVASWRHIFRHISIAFPNSVLQFRTPDSVLDRKSYSYGENVNLPTANQ